MLLAGLLVGAARAQETPAAGFAQANLVWHAAGLHDYQFALSHYCLCVPQEPIHIVVKKDQVFSARYTPSGKPVESLKGLPTLDGLMARIDAAYAQHAASIRLRLHPLLGYPEYVYIDYEAQVADEELSYAVSEFSR
ncbi:MAG: hypothetical protein HXX19_15120 [Rhodoferax sp.]|nr:hypothetical protein [Rhodoferax sp.]